MPDVRDERGTGGLEKLKKAAPGMTPGRPEIMTKKNASTVGITGGFYFFDGGRHCISSCFYIRGR